MCLQCASPLASKPITALSCQTARLSRSSSITLPHLPPRQLLAVNLLGPLWIQFICSSLHVQGRMPPKCGCDRAGNKGYCGGQGEGAEGKTGNELCPAVLLNWQVYSPFSTYPKNHWCDFFSVVSAGFTWTLEYSMHLKINGVRLLSV